jgi:hypothetical protein
MVTILRIEKSRYSINDDQIAVQLSKEENEIIRHYQSIHLGICNQSQDLLYLVEPH